MGGACLFVIPTLRGLKPRYGTTATGQDIALPERNNALMLWRGVQVNSIDKN